MILEILAYMGLLLLGLGWLVGIIVILKLMR